MRKETGGRELEKILGEWRENYYKASAANGEVYTSDFNIFSSSYVRASTAERIINGGKKIIYTAAVAAMLNANINQYAYGFTSNVPDGATSVVNDEIISSGAQHIRSGGTANNTTLITSGIQYISSGGVAMNTKVNLSSYQAVYNGGIANYTEINSGGVQYVSSGGLTNSAIILGGSQFVHRGGLANKTIISGGSQRISSGGTANGTVISNGGIQNISSGGVANNTEVNSGGGQYLYASAVANDTTINSGGSQMIAGWGVANGAIISGGGQYVYSSGSAVDTINRGGEVLLLTDGILSNYRGEGGVVNVYSDNTLKGQTVLTANAALNFGASGQQNVMVENLSSDKGIFKLKADLETHTGDKLSVMSSYDGSALISLK
ncbi:MAG: AIDA repeat-containing protein, partial [Elusimicrobiota bacterium]|nr:AIDA repeat-containing protein [Elusimicrobiota bacterium]